MFAPLSTFGSPLAHLHAAIDDCASEPVVGFSDAALVEDLLELRRAADRLEAEFARRLERLDRCRGFAAEGAISTASWLRHRCGLAGAAASERVGVARHLAELPLTQAALAQGEIGYDHARVITRTAESVGDEAMRGAEHILVDAAHRLDPARLQVVADHLRHYLAPERALRDANDAHDRRALFISPLLDGVFRIDGQLDREGAACLQAALEALLGPRAADDTRTPAQRRADALVERGRPHVTLIVNRDTLAGSGGTTAAELDRAGVVPDQTALRISCDAALSVVTLDGAGEPLDAGRSTRTVPPSLRRALAVRDRGRRFSGCDRPVSWTDGHHLRHWARGGATKLRNLVLLCRRHHRLVHEGGWRLDWGEHGELAAAPP
jgi:hypothetical protein